MVAFVAIENPASILGVKRREVVDPEHPPFAMPPSYTKVGELPGLKDKHIQRFNGLANIKPGWAKQGLAQDLLRDAGENRETVDKVLTLIRKAKAGPGTRVLMCGSVNSLAKYIVNHCVQNVGTQIDTLVIYGHGGSSAMNVGLGRIGGSGATDLREAQDEDDEEAVAGILQRRQLTGQDPLEGKPKPKPGRIREMSVDNQDQWGAAFASLQPHAATRDDSGCFHLFLMACSVGDEVDKPRQHKLVDVAAKVLKQRLQMPVSVAAPTRSINDDELYALLGKLPTICESLAGDEATQIGDIDLAFCTMA